MLLYPVYALLFADTGLSPAEISSLFILWSVTTFVFEIPFGLLADRFSRRYLVVAAPLCTAAGFALWTFLPSYPSFAVGFVLWGAGGSLSSGALEALVYEALERVGAHGAFARVIGRARALGPAAAMVATALAAPTLAVGGYLAVGVASVAVTLLRVPVAWSMPESRGSAEPDGDGLVGVLRAGAAEVRRSPRVRGAILLIAVLSGFDALEEYTPLLAHSTGVPVSAVPLLELLVMAGMAVGGWLAGRATPWSGPLLALGAVLLVAGAISGHAAGMVLVAAAFGIFRWASVNAEARLQDLVSNRSRATVTSAAGFGVEVVAVLVFAGYALGSTWAGPGPLFAVAAVPYLVVAPVMWRAWRTGGRGPRTAR
ncbi:putative MFS family arabinose efflux permease [Lipingzhangella halophila]|uniref:Putative MFS family arabinose efflux permease n=1 Tax=Lipingzhangella halophila TaxID=1783352 RepID=A0A7W7RL97_9ACTN|nr:MFS transporter [Lipingzhangella halophila]MBB4933608.1 putative MFS family arabinose efflux permease [Lipingzhangella halophila]